MAIHSLNSVPFALFSISLAPWSLPHLLGFWSIIVLPFYSLALIPDKTFLFSHNLNLHPAQFSPLCDDLQSCPSIFLPRTLQSPAQNRTIWPVGLANWVCQLFPGHMGITFVPESRGNKAIWITKHSTNLPSQGSHAKNAQWSRNRVSLTSRDVWRSPQAWETFLKHPSGNHPHLSTKL